MEACGTHGRVGGRWVGESVVTAWRWLRVGGGGIPLIYCKVAVTAGGSPATDATDPCAQVYSEGLRHFSLTCVEVVFFSVDSAD